MFFPPEGTIGAYEFYEFAGTKPVFPEGKAFFSSWLDGGEMPKILFVSPAVYASL